MFIALCIGVPVTTFAILFILILRREKRVRKIIHAQMCDYNKNRKEPLIKAEILHRQ